VELLVGLLDRLNDHFRVRTDRHEVRVATPARDDVGVEMLVDRPARSVPEVESGVDSVGVKRRIECRDRAG